MKADLTSLGGGTLDETTTLTKFYGGFRYNKYVSLGHTYFCLVQASVGQLGTGSNTVSGSVDRNVLGIYGVAFVPLTRRTEVIVKAGGASWEAVLDVTIQQQAQSASMPCMVLVFRRH